ncbi:MAG: amidase [Actinomycetia bacterium]|nr:amidase [Actinomycetes bacterium]MCP4086830.1 amidase [Actinomycetes bacterium]
MTELWKLSAVDIAAGVRGREYKPTEVLDSVLGRVEATNGELNAITYDLADRARAQAAAADDAVAAGGELGPLHGVPMTIKENVDQEGTPNVNGVPAFADNMATEDNPFVGHLRAAGAIFVGRTNTPEFSMRATTDNPLRGRTLNPWGEPISPGGSSGGAGSACAAGMGPLHHGNDIGGSLRFPSFANGVTTVKPTNFRVPTYNASAPAERGPLSQAMSVQGIIARHAADVRLATRVIVHPDPRDPNCPPVPFDGPALDSPITVAVTTETGGYDIHPGIVELIERAADQLRDAGYRVVEADPPPVAEAARGWFTVGSTEMEATLIPPMREYGSKTINDIFGWYFEMSEILDRDDYITTFGHRTRLMRDWNVFLDQHPLILTPFLMRPMYDHDYDARGFDEVKDMFESAIYSTGINYLGLPAGVIGMDLVEDRPAAIQIVGRRFREDIICDALAAIEARNGVLSHRLWEREDQS